MARMAGASLIAALVATQSSALRLDAASSAHRANWTDETFGKQLCPCVGVNGLAGTTTVTIGNTKYPNLYPSDIGSACSAWDAGKYPGSCDGGTPASWCSNAWCYVDPCACDIGTNPSTSDYLAGATYESKQIFYSYATCGTDNTYNTPPSDEQTAECTKPWDATADGLAECPCVGIQNIEGNTTVSITNTEYPNLYPSSLGSACVAWDMGRYPGSCDGTNPASWCSSAWCYVDRTNCVLPAGEKGPFPSGYIPNGRFQGEPLYYSYVTCSGANTYDPTTAAAASA